VNCHRLSTSAIVLLLATVTGAIAQGRACVETPDSEECTTCKQNFPAPEMTSFMCFDGGPVASARTPMPEDLSCDFSECPTDFTLYERCIDVGRALAETNEIKILEDRVSVLIEGPQETLCNPAIRDPIIADVEALAASYQDFTLKTGQAMTACLSANIAAQEELIEADQTGPGEGVQGRLRDARIRRARDRIKELHDLQGLQLSIGYSEVGEALADLRALSNELPSLCN